MSSWKLEISHGEELTPWKSANYINQGFFISFLESQLLTSAPLLVSVVQVYHLSVPATTTLDTALIFYLALYKSLLNGLPTSVYQAQILPPELSL